MTTAGIVLAAGAGRRMGEPKALVDGWLHHAVQSLAACDRTVVVLGAKGTQASRLLDPADVDVVVADDWEHGMSASLRAGIGALQHETRCLITLVDLPDVGADVVARVLEQPDEPQVLARATYHAVPGHPVLIGRVHWGGVVAAARGDRGARDYLRANHPVAVECGDLATGRDVDRPEQTQPGTNPPSLA